MRKIVLSIFAVLAVSLSAVAQNQQVSGTVRDADGAPVIGANVIVTNTTTGTSTGVDGSYTIQVPANGSLTFSYLGKVPQTVDVNRRSVIDIVMVDDSQTIDDVLVIAFGEANKTTFMGSATQLDGEELTKRTSTNVINSLSGQIAGVQIKTGDGQPGEEASMRIRGIMTINSSVSTAPLIILDGMEYTGGLSTINTNDIETFTVLKDAASAALYGSRGANGVVMVTTKKGRVGEAKVTVDMKVGVGSRMQKDYDLIRDPQLHYETVYASFKNYYYDELGYTLADANVQANNDVIRVLGYNVYETNGNLLIDDTGKLYENATLGNFYTGIDGKQYFITPDDWTKAAFKTSIRQEYNIGINAGTERSKFYGSIGYLDDQGIVSSSYVKRFTARLNSEYQAKKWLTVGGNFNFSNFDQSEPDGYREASNSTANIFAFTSQMAPIYPLYIRDENKELLRDARGVAYDYGDGTYLGYYVDDVGETKLRTRGLLAGANPIQSNKLDKNAYTQNQFNISGYAIAKFTDHLKLTVNGATSITEARWTNFTNPWYGQYASSKGSIIVEHMRIQNLNMTQMLDYNRTFGEKHNVTAMIGHDFSTNRSWDLWATRDHIFSPIIHELYNGVNLVNASSGFYEYLTEGYLARATYDYDQKYFASFSFRRDASTKFAPEHRWGNFWSVSGGWIISSEEFMQNLSWVDLLKFKASFGQRGNDGIPDFAYTTRFNITKADEDGNYALVFNGPGTRDITWETVTDLNVGFDFGLFNNRLTGTLEYYQRTATDLLFSVPAPPTAGYPSSYKNIGMMRNNGVELELHGVILQGKDYRLTLHGNITTNKSVVVDIPETNKLGDVLDPSGVALTNGFPSGSLWVGEGNAMYTFYLKRFAGLNEFGQSQWYDKVLNDPSDYSKGWHDEITTDYSQADYYVLEDKTAQPDAFGGFGFTFEYKGFDLSVNFDYQLGGWTYDSAYAMFMGAVTDGRAIHKDILDAWSPNNTSSGIPRWNSNDTYASAASDRFLVSSTYLNWGNVNVGYSFPSKWTKTMGIERIRLYASLENINYWTARRGMDSRASYSGGSPLANYSGVRTISGGLQIVF